MHLNISNSFFFQHEAPPEFKVNVKLLCYAQAFTKPQRSLQKSNANAVQFWLRECVLNISLLRIYNLKLRICNGERRIHLEEDESHFWSSVASMYIAERGFSTKKGLKLQILCCRFMHRELSS